MTEHLEKFGEEEHSSDWMAFSPRFYEEGDGILIK